MKILATLTPAAGRTPADFGPHIVAEEKAVWSAYKAGIIRELYFQPEPLTLTLVFEAEDYAAVQTTLATFPMIAAGLLDTCLVTLGPWTMFEALFDGAHR